MLDGRSEQVIYSLSPQTATQSSTRRACGTKAILPSDRGAHRVCGPGSMSVKRLSEHRDAFWHGDARVFLALHLQRDVAGLAGGAQDLCNPLIVEIERVPFAAARIRLGLDEHGLGRDGFKLFIGIFEEVL